MTKRTHAVILAAALAAMATAASCTGVESPTLVTLGADDGVPPLEVNGEEVTGIDVATCTGTEDVGDYTVVYTATADGGCRVSFNETVEIFDEEASRMASDQLGDQTIVGVSGIRLIVANFALADGVTGAPYDVGATNVSDLSLSLDGVLLQVELAGPFPQTVDVGDVTVRNVRDAIRDMVAANAVMDLSVTLTPAGRASFPVDVAITFSGQPEVDLAITAGQ